MKRFLSTLLAVMMILSSFTVFARGNDTFSDVGNDLYCSEAVNKLAQLDILNGYDDGLFRPWYSVTRAEMAAVIVRAAGLEGEVQNSRGNTDFYDVAANHWASGYINVAVRNGIINGVGDGRFCPEDPVKYEEAVKMVVCAEGLDEGMTIDGVNWAEPYLTVANKAGITSNLAAGRGDILARSDVAVMVYNGLKADIVAPRLSIRGGTYSGDQTVAITTKTPNADILYTLDGSNPIDFGDIYTGPIVITQTTDLRAVTVKYGGIIAGDVIGAQYDILVGSSANTGSLERAGKFSIVFDLNYLEADNSTAPSTQRVSSGMTAEVPEAPVREGYSFAGWSTSRNGAEMFDFSTPIIKNTILYAVWDNGAGNFTVTFDLNYDTAEEAPAAQTVASGAKAELPANPVRAGYAFLGWSQTQTGETLFNLNNAITENMTLYAKWAVRTGEGPVSLDDKNKDVEIYSFNADITDILVGEVKTVTFTAEIFANVVLGADDVKFIDAAGNVLGIMRDNGENGDAVAKDGIYTIQYEFSANKIGNKLYFASCRDEKSSGVNIGYYRVYTQEDYTNVEKVSDALNDIVKSSTDETGAVAEGTVEEVVKKVEELKASGEVEDYVSTEKSVKLTLKDGLPIVYMFPSDDEYEGDSDKVSIMTFEPYKGTLSSPILNEDMDRASDGDAQLIAARDTHYMFTGNYDLADVNLEKIHEIAKAGIMIWIGHGGYHEETGSAMGTGEIATRESVVAYSKMIGNGSLELWAGVGGKRFAITGGYVKEELKDLHGSLIYLIACHSGQDMIDNVENRYSLAQAFIDNGAAAVVGTSNAVKCDYAHRFTLSLFDRLTSGANGKYYTLAESLEYAKTQQGATDKEGTEFIIFPQNSTAAQNFRLSEEVYGKFDGSIKDAATDSAVPNALLRVYKDGALIDETRTDDEGYGAVELPVGEYIVQVDAGHYKSTKFNVSVNEGEITHSETTPMINVEVQNGHANGTIVNAHNGDPVEGLTLKFRREWNNYYGDIMFTAATDANGVYSVENVSGHYTVEYSKYGYITGYRNIIIADSAKASGQNATITPTLESADSFRITLTWRDHPSDLDSHITGPMGSERFHVYFANKNVNFSSNGNANLDLDNTSIRTNPNPETITVTNPTDGIYRYTVYDFSNGGNDTSVEMASSNAVINVYYGNSGTAVATYYVPVTGVGTVWTVFEIEVKDGKLLPPKKIDTVGNDYTDVDM